MKIALILAVAATLLGCQTTNDMPMSHTTHSRPNIDTTLLKEVIKNSNSTLKKQIICPAVYQPVCATVGDSRYEFGNQCEAYSSGGTNITLGGCGSDR